ncbi:hypothetical protein CDAR_448691 [Caerostris darwini]|uniref:Uncharacterized protein n=1 Tax=Caerostris darwini TaxID=1538125 RepID=A0AAV4QNZ8_9ARAC|nr:hypothetical protein CDAR_448691 [Caerostris darwini]
MRLSAVARGERLIELRLSGEEARTRRKKSVTGNDGRRRSLWRMLLRGITVSTQTAGRNKMNRRHHPIRNDSRNLSRDSWIPIPSAITVMKPLFRPDLDAAAEREKKDCKA